MQFQSQSSASAEEGAPASLFAQYTPRQGVYDEMLAEDGRTRPGWDRLRNQLDKLGAAELGRRWSQSQQLIYENGITYSAFGDADSRPRPWALDPAPLLIQEAQWKAISDGLQQRATLLELILQDLYGPRRLVSEGVLPPELLFAHPGFQAPLQRTDGQPSRQILRFYAADLGRSPDGQWWVMADRTEAPSGAGFALENRLVTSRMLNEAFRSHRVCRLAPFFIRFQESLRKAAGQGDNPNIGLLSQGPTHPNYFEDAYLARYLGYTLVEGGDLTVRNRHLWMKTLDGLAPIDVLVRRPNTEVCDPLELGGESHTGVAGLLQAERDGNVLVANAGGSGLVESPAFMAFMPRLCQALLGQPLKLPGVATWWCGEPESMEFVLNNADRLVLKKAFRQRGEETLLLTDLSKKPRAELEAILRADPFAFAAQEQVARSTAPALRDNRIEPVRIALRAFLACDRDNHHVMDGALARTLPEENPLAASLQEAEGSKDVWIVGEKPVSPITLLPSEQQPTELVRLGNDLPSRVAEHSFWMGRHLERADAHARLVRLVASRLSSESEASDFAELPALVRCLAEQGLIEPGHAVSELKEMLPKVERALPREVLDRQQPGSLAATVERLFHSAANVRDRLSRDTWRIVRRVAEKFRRQRPTLADLTTLLRVTDALVIDLSAIGGMVIESMTRTQFYRFLDFGRRLERAMQSVDLIRICVVDQSTPKSLLEALIESADSLMTYRARYRARVELAPALDLLITDETNPRSIAYQLNTLERHVGKLPRSSDGEPGASAEARLTLSIAHAIRVADIEMISEACELGDRRPLEDLLGELERDLPVLSNALALKYFAHAGPPRQLSFK